MFKALFLLILLFGFSERLLGEEFTAHITLPSSPVHVGDKVHIGLALTYPASYHPDLEQLKQHLQEHSPLRTAPFLLIDAKEEVKEESIGVKSSSIDFLIQLQIAGPHPITFYDISFVPSASSDKPVSILSEVELLQVDPLPLVETGVTAEESFLPLSPAWPLGLTLENASTLKLRAQMQPARNERIFQQAAIPWRHIAVVCFCILLMALIKRYLIYDVEVTPEQRRAIARHAAMDALDRLSKQSLPLVEKYEKITEVIRHYLAECEPHSFPPAATIEECLMEIKRSGIVHTELREPLTAFLKKADLVQFATAIPTAEDCAHADALAHKMLS